MSSNANSNRDDDKFFPPRTDDEKPKAPGAFTQQFMGTSAPTGPTSPLDSKTPPSPTPFTAQFGSVNPFSGPESRTASVPERVSEGSQQPASGESFTNMFGSNATSQKQAFEPQTEVTRVFDRAATKSQVPQETKPSGFTEMFGSVRPASPESTQPSVASDPFQAKTPDFTELFKPAAPAAPSTPAAQVPLSPLSAQPGTGRFTELFKNELPSAAPKPAPAPTPFSSSGPSGFTELFKSSSLSSQRSAPPPATPPATESTPGGFTQLFKGSVPSARPTPVPPKPAGELTQMISGGIASKPPSAPSPGAGATRLFSGESSAAPAMGPLPPGPSEYTRIVSPRQLRELQQATPAANNAAPSAATGQAPALPGAPQMPAWPIPTAAPAPQLASPPMPQGVPSWQPPQVQVQPAPPLAWQPPQVPAPIPPAAAPTPVPKAESKILTYLPLIIGLNVLFLIAVLLILLFALKR